MDEADIAQIELERQYKRAEDERKNRPVVYSHTCRACGLDLEPIRREFGTHVECQERIERKEKGYVRG